MIAFILDPALFSVPPNVADESEIHALILRIVEWDELTSGGSPLHIFKPYNTEDVLFNHNCWPIDPDIKSVIEDSGLSHVFTPQEVVSVYHSLMAKAGIISDHSGFEAVECSDIVLQPNATDFVSPASLASASKLTYVNGCISGSFVPPWKAIIISGSSQPETTNIVVSGSILNARGEAAEGAELPIAVLGDALMVRRFFDIHVHEDALKLWSVAEDHRDYLVAIAVRAMQILVSGGVPVEEVEVPAFALGTDFVDSLLLNQAGAGQAKGAVVLETCARAVAGVPKYQVSAMGKSKQTTRAGDHATGWRTHVTKSHEALRLMMWWIGDRYELANVGGKGELVIATGDVGQRFEFQFPRVI